MSSSPGQSLPSQPHTIKKGGGRTWIHAAPTRGRFTRLRLVTAVILLAVFYATPWLTIDGQPFLRLSFLSGSFVMFGQPILMHEFHHFVLLALLLVFTLFLASAVAGRIWCGYSCPQTVFVEQIFGRIETLIEGAPARRILDEKKPLTWQRFARKVIKQILYLTVSASFAFTIVALFTGPQRLFDQNQEPLQASLLLLTALAWFDGAYWREQFCHIVCPYGRFQGVMQDPATRTIGYDARRGEPRRRGTSRVGAGDCIDCGLCVRVCPAGIDIRHGAHQLECVACAKCIDACDSVMASVKKPSGLIRYDAVTMFSTEAPSTPPPILRTRLVVLGIIWLGLFTFGLYEFISRVPFHWSVLGTRGATPYVVDGATLKNLLTIKIGNQSPKAETFELTAAYVDQPTRASQPFLMTPNRFGPLAPGEEKTFPVLLAATRDDSEAAQRIILRLRALGVDETRTIEHALVGPTPAQGSE